MTRHHLFNPEDLPTARGFSHGALAADGRVLHIAGQTGQQADGSFPDGLIAQFNAACRSVARVIEDAGGEPTDLVSMTIYTTVVDEYRQGLGQLGEGYREAFGRHYPAMALFGVPELFDEEAVVELVCVAVVPDGATRRG